MLSQQEQSELITAIKGRGEIPLKFAYVGKGAQNWAAISKHRAGKGKGINTIEGKLLRDRVNSFIATYGKAKRINVLDIGCGDATPTYPILDHLRTLKIPFTYVPIDISDDLLDLASKNVKRKYPGTTVKKFRLDFERGNFSDITYELKRDGSSNLLVFLGSTVGNFSDPSAILKNFRDSMGSDDYLIVGVQLTNIANVPTILPQYRNSLSEKFVYFMPNYIGVKRNATKYLVSWNEQLHQVEMRMLINRSCTVRIGKERFSLEKGEQILLARSAKFAEWNFTKLFSDVGFRTELLTTTPDRGYVLSMVQPTRYTT